MLQDGVAEATAKAINNEVAGEDTNVQNHNSPAEVRDPLMSQHASSEQNKILRNRQPESRQHQSEKQAQGRKLFEIGAEKLDHTMPSTTRGAKNLVGTVLISREVS